MPRLKKATDANGSVFYPITIAKGVYDTDNNQRLSVTLGQKADTTAMNAAIYPKFVGISIDNATGAITATYDNGPGSSSE